MKLGLKNQDTYSETFYMNYTTPTLHPPPPGKYEGYSESNLHLF
jgi:hypothetical protein